MIDYCTFFGVTQFIQLINGGVSWIIHSKCIHEVHGNSLKWFPVIKAWKGFRSSYTFHTMCQSNAGPLWQLFEKVSPANWNQSPAPRFHSDWPRNPFSTSTESFLWREELVNQRLYICSRQQWESVSSTVVPQWLPPKQHGAPPPPVATVVTIHRLYRRDISVVTFTVALTFNNVDNLMFMILQYKKEAAPFRNHVRLGLVLPFLEMRNLHIAINRRKALQINSLHCFGAAGQE